MENFALKVRNFPPVPCEVSAEFRLKVEIISTYFYCRAKRDPRELAKTSQCAALQGRAKNELIEILRSKISGEFCVCKIRQKPQPTLAILSPAKNPKILHKN